MEVTVPVLLFSFLVVLVEGGVVGPQTTTTTTNTPPTNTESNRTSRKIFHKLHSGVSFLTGLKLGTLLGRHHQQQLQAGHGSMASSHSFTLFGKEVHSALSLSYGDTAVLLPVLDDPISGSREVLHVTLVEEPARDLDISSDSRRFLEEHNRRVHDLNEKQAILSQGASRAEDIDDNEVEQNQEENGNEQQEKEIVVAVKKRVNSRF